MKPMLVLLFAFLLVSGVGCSNLPSIANKESRLRQSDIDALMEEVCNKDSLRLSRVVINAISENCKLGFLTGHYVGRFGEIPPTFQKVTPPATPPPAGRSD